MYKDITIEEIVNTFKCKHKQKSPEIDKMNFSFHCTSTNDENYFRNH